MSKTILFHGALVTICDTDFKCPECGEVHNEADWYPRLNKSKHGVIYRNCKNDDCGQRIGVSTDMKGDVVVWLKNSERK